MLNNLYCFENILFYIIFPFKLNDTEKINGIQEQTVTLLENDNVYWFYKFIIS